MQQTTHFPVQFPGVPALRMFADRQTYRDVLYLLLALPLGVCYFTALAGGVTLSLGTLGLWYGVARLEASGIELVGLTLAGLPLAIIAFVRLGVPILRGTGWLARRLAQLERRLTASLLGVDFLAPDALGVVAPACRDGSATPGLSARATWYLLIKYPLGMCSFAACGAALLAVAALVSAPLTYGHLSVAIAPRWQVDLVGEAVALSAAGGLLACALLPALRTLARLSGRFARVMLAGTEPRATGDG